MRLDGILAELTVKVAPSIYRKCITHNAKGKPVLYIQLEKAVYAMMKSALLFYHKLVADLTSLGYKINSDDLCVASKMINGKQTTICWHVGNLFLGTLTPALLLTFITGLRNNMILLTKSLT
jgi:hypothetical protein